MFFYYSYEYKSHNSVEYMGKIEHSSFDMFVYHNDIPESKKHIFVKPVSASFVQQMMDKVSSSFKGSVKDDYLHEADRVLSQPSVDQRIYMVKSRDGIYDKKSKCTRMFFVMEEDFDLEKYVVKDVEVYSGLRFVCF